MHNSAPIKGDVTDDIIKIIVGNRIRYEIENKGLTQKWVAQQAQISESGLKKILDAKSAPSNITAGRLAQVLDVSPDWFAPKPESLTAKRIELHLTAFDQFERSRSLVKDARKAAVQEGLEMLENTLPYEGPDETQQATPPEINIVGYVGAGEEVFAYDDFSHGDGMDTVEGQVGMPPSTVAARMKGESHGNFFGREAVIFWSTRRYDVTEFIGELVVCHLTDGRKLVKMLDWGSAPGLFNLNSTNIGPLKDQVVESVSPIDWIKMR